MPLTNADRKAIKQLMGAGSVGCGHIDAMRHRDPYRKGLVSTNAGCHASQVDEFNKVLDGHGITQSRFMAEGQEINGNKAKYGGELYLDSRTDRNKILKIFRKIDRDGGYGDHS